MSHSGSRTPTHNPVTSNIINSPQSTTTRPQNIDEIPSEHPSENRSRPPVTPPSLEPQIAESSSRRRTASESPTDKPMAKRIRRESPELRDRASFHGSSSSSDSQSEKVVEKIKRPEPLASTTTTTPPKKKRTRTLTTPQQSAVLHALLAKVSILNNKLDRSDTNLECDCHIQSRFPTTAMREDVGRSIGLSARKVQVCVNCTCGFKAQLLCY